MRAILIRGNPTLFVMRRTNVGLLLVEARAPGQSLTARGGAAEPEHVHFGREAQK